jgi:predicted transcriptional regulator
LKRYKRHEEVLLEVAHTAYKKIQKTCSSSDPEVKEINRRLREILGEKQEDEVIQTHERKKASKSRSRSKNRSIR